MTQQSVSIYGNVVVPQFVEEPNLALTAISAKGIRRGRHNPRTGGKGKMVRVFPIALRIALFVFAVSLGSFIQPATAQVTLFTNQGPFVSATGALLIRFPAVDQTGMSLGYEDVTITAPNAVVRDFGVLGRGTIVYDVPPLGVFASPTVPATTAGILAAHGEDDYLLSFTKPVCAVGLYLITNFAAREKITVQDAVGTTIYAGSLDALTAQNALAFIGIKSSIPIKTVFLNTESGGSQNESIFEIWRQYCP